MEETSAPARSARGRPVALPVAVLVAVAALIAAALQPAAAAGNPYQRGPAPTLASVAASSGPFATAQMNVAPGNGLPRQVPVRPPGWHDPAPPHTASDHTADGRLRGCLQHRQVMARRIPG